MLEKLLLASIVTFSLYLFAQLGGGYSNQTNLEINPSNSIDFSLASAVINNN